jgi:hypothetical protein
MTVQFTHELVAEVTVLQNYRQHEICALKCNHALVIVSKLTPHYPDTSKLSGVNVLSNVHVDGVRLCLWTAATTGHTVHPPDDTWVWTAMVERYWQEKTEELREKPCPSATLSTTNLTWTDPGTNSDLRGERLATNLLSHGTALTLWSNLITKYSGIHI